MKSANFRQILQYCKTSHIEFLTDIQTDVCYSLEDLERFIRPFNEKAGFLKGEYMITDQCLVGFIYPNGKFKPIFYYGNFAD